MSEENPQNNEKIVIHDANGKFIKGHPKIGGIQKGQKHPISVIGTIENMFENDPAMFLEFVDKYLRDPRNRQHIVEMIDGRPKGAETNVNVAIQNNIVWNKDEAIDAVKETIKDFSIKQEDVF